MHRNRLLIVKASVKVLAFEQLRDCVLCHQPHKIVGGKRTHPPPVEINHSLLWIENLENLRLVSLGILFDLLTAKRRPGDRSPRRVPDHPRKIANQKDCGMPEILEMLQLAEDHRMAKVQVRRSRVHAEFHAKRLTSLQRPFKFRAKVRLANDFRGALLEISKLFVYGGEGGHARG